MMEKAIPKFSSRSRRIGGLHNKKNDRIRKVVIHVQASFNNTIVTITDIRGQVILWSSAGTFFQGARKGTPFAAQTTAKKAIRTVDQDMQRAEVMIRGPGLGRDVSLRVFRRNGLLLNFVRDVSSMPRNGCRPPKKKRL